MVVDPLVMPIGALGDAGRQVFALLRRLREELKVNTTCGLSNISFGLPHRHGINGAFIPMVIGAGMTSAIMNPCRPQEMEAVRGANVLAGTDKDCMTWIRTYKDYKPAEGMPRRLRRCGQRAGRRRAARRSAARRPRSQAWRRRVSVSHLNPPANIKDPLVLFMPSGKRGRFPVGTPVLDAARSLGVYVESVCGGRATCGRCQIEVQEGNFAKHKIVSSLDHISRQGAEGGALRARARPARRAPPFLLGH